MKKKLNKRAMNIVPKREKKRMCQYVFQSWDAKQQMKNMSVLSVDE